MKTIYWPMVIAVACVVELHAEELPDRAKVVRHRPSAVVEEGKSFWNGSGMRMIWVTPGKFLMGSPPLEVGRRHGEDQVEVEISTGFWLGATEVTRGHWTSVMERGGEWNSTGGSTVPMQAFADKATQFCLRLTELEVKRGRIPKGFRYQLPTEAQWEFACRAGTKGPHAGEFREMAWFRGHKGESEDDLGYVAQKKPNPWGFYDMHGNLEEWCSDWYDPILRGGKDPAGPDAGAGEGPWYPLAGRGRVRRGGSVFSDMDGCRSAARSGWSPGIRYSRWGFRVALRPIVAAKPEHEPKTQRR